MQGLIVHPTPNQHPTNTQATGFLRSIAGSLDCLILKKQPFDLLSTSRNEKRWQAIFSIRIPYLTADSVSSAEQSYTSPAT